MNNEFVIRPSACSHAEETLEKIKCGLLHQLACLYESKVYGSYSGSCLATKSAEVLPEICERPDCPLATVVVYKYIADVYICVKLLHLLVEHSGHLPATRHGILKAVNCKVGQQGMGATRMGNEPWTVVRIFIGKNTWARCRIISYRLYRHTGGDCWRSACP